MDYIKFLENAKAKMIKHNLSAPLINLNLNIITSCFIDEVKEQEKLNTEFLKIVHSHNGSAPNAIVDIKES